MTSSDNEFFIPMEVDEQAILDLQLSPKAVVRRKIGYRMTNVVLVPCTRQQYYDYMRFVWADEQQTHRARKCRIPSEKTGKLVRCRRSCKDCSRMKDGSAFSLSPEEDDEGTLREDSPIPAPDRIADLLTRVWIDGLLKVLRAEREDLCTVFSLMLDGASTQEIADALGKSRQTASLLIGRVRQIVRQELQEME